MAEVGSAGLKAGTERWKERLCISACAGWACQRRLAGVRPARWRRGGERSAPRGCWLSRPRQGTGEPGAGGVPAAAAPSGGKLEAEPGVSAGTLLLRLWQELPLPFLVFTAAGDAFSSFQGGFLVPLIGSVF